MRKIAERYGIYIHQNYRQINKQLLRETYNGQHPKRKKQAVKARKKLRTIAGRMLREMDLVLSSFELMIYE